MSIRDIIKGSFIDQFSSDLSVKSIILMLFMTAIIGIYIFFVYRQVVSKAFYSKSFAISLVVISMITGMIILTVQSNIVISLGMVGALSIVRFRTAIKEPMDLAFLFWTISTGIICGAGIYEIAILGLVKDKSKRFEVKSKKVSASGLDMIIEAKGICDESELVNSIMAVEGVRQTTIMTHDGETTL